MSIIVASGERISKSPINNSTSKQMYSFSKAERFNKPKTSDGSKFYDLPSVFSKRAASLGKGIKYDFTKENKGKCDKYYDFQSDFDPKKSHLPRFTFGIARNYYDKVFYETNRMIDKNVPGPGRYDVLQCFGKDALKFGLKGKGKNFMSETSRMPGPGQYETISLSNTGKYPLSNLKNLRTVKFGNKDDKRFVYSFSNNPGPSHYEIKPLINGKGFNFLSKFKSNNAFSMNGKYKDGSRNNYPGPGTYVAPSEFGIYESKYASISHNVSQNDINRSKSSI